MSFIPRLTRTHLHKSITPHLKPRYITSTPQIHTPASALAYQESPEDMSVSTQSFQTAAEWASFGKDHVSHGLGRLRDHVVVKGKGLELETLDGKRLLDFTAGIGVTNLGHCHPHVNQAAISQISSLQHLQCSISFHQPYLQLIQKLLPAMPHPSLDQFFFWNSGSEAVEAAVKVARVATGRQGVVVFQGAYHGRTMGSGGMTRSKPIYTQGTGPLMPGVYATAYPYWHSLGVPPSTSEDELVRLAEHQLDMLFRQQVNPKDVAAVFIEPVQGEGGYVPCPPAFLHLLQKLCNSHGILLVLDEVQTGFFRTGTYFASTPLNLKPDIMIYAKGIANGFPLSGIVSTKEIMGKLDVGSMGGTYAGNAVACAAGVAAQEVFQSGEVDVAGNVKRRGEELLGALRELMDGEAKELICDVRGIGLMIAVEFRHPSDPLTHEGLPPNTSIPPNIGKRIQDLCLEEGLLILTTSCFDTIRFIPALIVSEAEMGEAIEIFRRAVRRVVEDGKGARKQGDVGMD